jgi:hypothetical protein
MPKKTMYPCQYPGCDARYDETIAGTTETTHDGDVEQTLPGVLTGWVWPHAAEQEGDVGTHDHILNIMHKVEVDDE